MATWEERNQQARTAGYRNYYDYRIHGYGKIAPDQPVTGETLARARGHRSRADFYRTIESGDVISIWGLGPRNQSGQYKWVDLLVQKDNGEEKLFRLRSNQITADELDKLVSSVESTGAILSPGPSLDIRRLIEEVTDEGIEGEEE